MSDFFNPEATPPLDEFLTDYNDNDNIWWAMSCGHHMNLFDAAIERIDELTGEREMLWGKVAELTRQRDSARALAIEAGAFTSTDEYGVQRLDAKGNPLYGVDIYAGRESAEKVINTPRYRLGAARVVHRTVTEWVAIEAGAFL
jgi:hypothetical protein